MKKISFLLLFLFVFSYTVYADDKNIYVVKIDEIITSSTSEIIKETIKKAGNDNNSLVLIELNTPGGVLEDTRKIVSSIFESKNPVIVYVSPSGARAGSAGIFITLAANYAVMASGTNIGAAHPVNADGKDIEGDIGKKIENDTVAFITSIAEKRHRNIKAAQDAVIKSSSYTDKEALKLGLIDNITTDKNIFELIKEKYNINGNLTPIYIERTFIQNIHKFLANPNILAAMLFIGMLMISIELKTGTFIFGGIGAVAFIIFAIGANIIPINYLAILVILAGFGLLIAELFITSFGLLTLGSIISIILGLKMLFDRDTSMGIDVSLPFIISIVAIVVLIAFLLGRLIVKDFKRKGVTGMEALIDKKATVIDWDKGKGHVTLHGEIWNAIGDDFQVDDEVVITGYIDMVLKVEKSKA